MTEHSEDRARRTAVAVGHEVEGLAAWVVDRFEDVSLLVMERVADAAPRSEALTELSRVMISLRRLAAPMPRLAGRVAAGAYFGLRMGIEMYRGTQDDADAAPSAPPVPDRDA